MTDLKSLRSEIELINEQILELLCRRGQLVGEVQKQKTALGLPTYQPDREEAMLDELVTKNSGPFDEKAIRKLFKAIFATSRELMKSQKERVLAVSRANQCEDTVITVRGRVIGEAPIMIAGPCAVESEEQMEMVGRRLSSLGIGFLRGGAFKPRSSPYSFQGLGARGLEILEATARRHDLVSVTEVMDTRDVELVAEHADVLQVGTRNMYNSALLKELGRIDKPVLLKRGLSATIDELMWAAEYIVASGNCKVILCERGIRTFERETRNTLDISSIPVLAGKCHLPVIVDVSHAAGRKDIIEPLAKAALAVGAAGVMIEAHPNPPMARSDSQQQLDLEELEKLTLSLGLIETTPGKNKETTLGKPTSELRGVASY